MYDGLAAPMEEDVLSSYDYWDLISRPLQPEERLMLGVLEDAIACLQKNAGRPNSLLFRETANWFLEEKSKWLFSFENICAVLAINSDRLRQRLLCWQGKVVALQTTEKPLFTKSARRAQRPLQSSLGGI